MAAIFYTLATIKARLAEADKERGATMVEYGLLVALIAIAAIVGVVAIGDNLLLLFNDVAGRL